MQLRHLSHNADKENGYTNLPGVKRALTVFGTKQNKMDQNGSNSHKIALVCTSLIFQGNLIV